MASTSSGYEQPLMAYLPAGMQEAYGLNPGETPARTTPRGGYAPQAPAAPQSPVSQVAQGVATNYALDHGTEWMYDLFTNPAARQASDWGFTSALSGAATPVSSTINSSFPALSEALGSSLPEWGYTSAVSGAPVSVPSSLASFSGGLSSTFGGSGAAMGLGNYLGAAGGLYGLADLAMNRESSDIKAALQGAGSGALVGWNVGGPIGALVGGGVGGLYGLGTSMFGSGKDPAQKERDNIKKQLQSQGLVTNNWGIKTPYGEYELRDNPEFFTPDQKYSYANQIKDLAEPFAYLMTNGHEQAPAYAGWLTNAALQNSTDPASARANLLYTVKQWGLKPSQVIAGIQQSNLAPELKQQWIERVNSLRKKGNGNTR